MDERIVHTAKRSLVIKQAVKELRSYYMHLGLDNPGLTRAARLPHPTYAVASEAVQQLHFVDRFHYEGLHSDDQDHFDRSLFSATLNNKPVLVKFCTQYGEEAHGHLASHGLAPRLHCCVELAGRVIMVVMDVVEGASSAFYKYRTRHLPSDLAQKVKDAVKVLHDGGYVHGDIRRPNVLVEADERGVLLIDFDWAAKAGQARYPVTLNLSGQIPWATGTKAGGVIGMAHDDHVVEILCTE